MTTQPQQKEMEMKQTQNTALDIKDLHKLIDSATGGAIPLIKELATILNNAHEENKLSVFKYLENNQQLLEKEREAIKAKLTAEYAQLAIDKDAEIKKLQIDVATKADELANFEAVMEAEIQSLQKALNIELEGEVERSNITIAYLKEKHKQELEHVNALHDDLITKMSNDYDNLTDDCAFLEDKLERFEKLFNDVLNDLPMLSNAKWRKAFKEAVNS